MNHVNLFDATPDDWIEAVEIAEDWCEREGLGWWDELNDKAIAGSTFVREQELSDLLVFLDALDRRTSFIGGCNSLKAAVIAHNALAIVSESGGTYDDRWPHCNHEIRSLAATAK